MESKKLTKVLVGIIILLLIGIGFSFYRYKTLPLTPSLVGQKKSEVLKWAERQKYAGLSFEYEENSEYEKDIVLSQSIEPGKYLGEKLVLKISSGKPELPIIEIPKLKDKTEAEKWAKEQGIIVEYKYEDSNLEKDWVVRIEPKENVTKETKLTIVLSSGPKEEEDEKDTRKSYDMEEDFYIFGMAERDFINKMNAAGLNTREIDPYYSFDAKPGTVYYYTKGVVKEGETIIYALSRGPYEFDESDYLGLDEYEADDFVQNQNNKNARISISFDEGYSSVKKGKIYSCSCETYDYIHYVECMISLGEKPVDPTPQPQPDPEPQPDPQPQPDPEPEPSTEPVPEPVQTTAYIPAMNVFESMLYNSADEAESALRNGTFANFTNVSYSKNKTKDYLMGSIYQIEVNGNAAYEPGNYPTNTPITVYISNGY